MSVTTQTASTELRLALTSQLAVRLNVSTATYGALLGDLLEEASGFVESYLDRPIRYQVYAESVPSFDSEFLTLTRVPLVAITSIVNSTGTTISSTRYEIYSASAGLVYNSTGWGWSARKRGDVTFAYVPGSEKLEYTVTYGAGYLSPGVTSAASGAFSSQSPTLPRQIRLATLRLAGGLFSDLDLTSTGFHKLRTDDFEIQTKDRRSESFTGINSEIKSMLRAFVLDL